MFAPLCMVALTSSAPTRPSPHYTLIRLFTGNAYAIHLTPDQSPCLALPPEAWDEPHLLPACPHCDKPVKFNPFIIDNRGVYRRGFFASIRRLFRHKDRP